MRSEGFPKRFSLSRWLEGPLEGMMELSDDVEQYKAKMQMALGFSILIMNSFIIMLAITLILDLWSLLYPLISSALLPENIGYVVATASLSSIFIAVAILSSLLMVQVLRYLNVMVKRFENVEELFEVSRVSDKMLVEVKEAEEKSDGKEEIPAPFNLLGASSSFTRDIVKNMPQVSQHLRFARSIMIFVLLYYFYLRFLIPLLFGGDIGPAIELSFEGFYEFILIIISLLSVVCALMLEEASRFMKVLHKRMKIIERVKGAPLPLVPQGDTPADSLVMYLKSKDRCFGKLESSDGGEYAIRYQDDDCVVLVKLTRSPPTLEMVRAFGSKVSAHLETFGAYIPPKGRFIILYTPESGLAEDIGDEVYDYLKANPVQLGRGPGAGRAETVVQIMIEEEGAYGVFPFVE